MVSDIVDRFGVLQAQFPPMPLKIERMIEEDAQDCFDDDDRDDREDCLEDLRSDCDDDQDDDHGKQHNREAVSCLANIKSQLQKRLLGIVN